MKKLLVFLSVVTLILSISLVGIGCKKEAAKETAEAVTEEAVGETAEAVTEEAVGETAEGKAEKRDIRIVWVMDQLNESQMGVIKYMQVRIDQINQERDDINITLDYMDAAANVDSQLSLLEDVKLIKPEILVFSWIDKDAVRPFIKDIYDSGVTVVDLRDMGDPDIVSGVFYGYHEPTYAKLMKGWLTDYLNNNPDFTMKAGLVYGLATMVPQLMREDLVKELAEEMPDRVKIVAEAYGDLDPTKCMNIIEDWLQAYPYPEMNYINCINAGSAQGVVEALKSAGVIDDYLVTAVDLSDTGIRMVRDGEIDALVGNNNPMRASKMVDYALALFEGKTTEKTYAVTNSDLLDSSNIEDFLKMMKEDYDYTLPE
jgi:ABC-type sugar transport system substrate-binding protein